MAQALEKKTKVVVAPAKKKVQGRMSARHEARLKMLADSADRGETTKTSDMSDEAFLAFLQSK